MKKVSKERVSRYRKDLVELLSRLKHLCMKAGHEGVIFRGTPVNVYRKCGKSGCRCEEGGEARHGPYRVIQTWDKGKQRQISLKGSEGKYFEMAKHYQYQQQNRRRIIKIQEEILKQVDLMLKARTIWEKE